MKAMILAAGRGKRMGELTEKLPKPLLKVGEYTLIEWQILRLREHGFAEIVINLGYLGEQIRAHLGDGSRLGVKIAYSTEPQTGLETGGGVFQALPLLGEAPFLLTNADVFCDYPYRQLAKHNPASVHLVLVDNPAFKARGDFSIANGLLQTGGGVFQALPLLGEAPFLLTNADVFCDYPYHQLAEHNPTSVHLVLVDNPAFKARGDFNIENGLLQTGEDFTFAGISVINPKIFADCEAGFYPIAPLFNAAIADKTATAEHFNGLWHDVGTPERLAQAAQHVK